MVQNFSNWWIFTSELNRKNLFFESLGYQIIGIESKAVYTVRYRPSSWAGFDYCVNNESLETLYWLKWGFVIMIIGYIYSQKCNENAKKKRLIYFELWKLWKHSFVYILKKKSYQNSKCNNPFQFGIFLTFLTINIASDHNNKSSFQPV